MPWKLRCFASLKVEFLFISILLCEIILTFDIFSHRLLIRKFADWIVSFQLSILGSIKDTRILDCGNFF